MEAGRIGDGALVEGQAAYQTFAETINLHLA